MSGIDGFLGGLQQGLYHPPYGSMGDLIYNGNLNCIRTYFRAYFPAGVALTEEMRECDAELRACRQHIEYSYGKGANLFRIIATYSHLRLAQSNPYALELLRMSHFLVNIHNILRGSTSSGYDQFDIEPPTLEEYLQI